MLQASSNFNYSVAHYEPPAPRNNMAIATPVRPHVHFETAEPATVLELEDEPEAEPLQLSYQGCEEGYEPY